MSRRDQIKMSDEELAAFLDEQRVVIVASNGKDGFPHLMPLWYVVRTPSGAQEGELWGWTYGKSQKVRNLERDDRATLQIEDGEEYSELRGVMYKARVVIHRDIEAVAPIGMALAERYGGGGGATEEQKAVFEQQAAKRVAFQFKVQETVTWDHRKLGGIY
jgi:nitroimidazol reductase NimA-like FMN-containing flavoprotein (pyridoxamine 5'-phosphate oxidase superfamily)